jgi:hypothetical protein
MTHPKIIRPLAKSKSRTQDACSTRIMPDVYCTINMQPDLTNKACSGEFVNILTKKAGVRRQKAGGAAVSIETLVLGSEPSLSKE